MHPVLVIDRNFNAHRVVGLRDAIRYLCKKKVVVERFYADTDLRVTSLDIRQMPAVVRLLDAIPGGKRAVKFSRINILTRDRWVCCYCGRGPLPARDLTYDHVVPRCQGGRTEWANIASACISCNNKKGARTPAQAGMRLRVLPVRPVWLPITMLRTLGGPIPAAWRGYWTVGLLPGEPEEGLTAP